MSVLVIKIKNEQNIPTISRVINAFKEKVDVMSDEEYRDHQFASLIEDAKDSKVVTKDTLKKELKKRGITY